MARAVDAFGVQIDAGDYILSAASRTGLVKLGYAEFRQHSLYMSVEYADGHVTRRSSEVGVNVVVLRKVDGSVPLHVIGERNV